MNNTEDNLSFALFATDPRVVAYAGRVAKSEGHALISISLYKRLWEEATTLHHPAYYMRLEAWGRAIAVGLVLEHPDL